MEPPLGNYFLRAQIGQLLCEASIDMLRQSFFRKVSKVSIFVKHDLKLDLLDPK